MADINKLKDKIKSTIYPNGKGAINASDHQAMLLDMADGMAETDTKLAKLSEETRKKCDTLVISNNLLNKNVVDYPNSIIDEWGVGHSFEVKANASLSVFKVDVKAGETYVFQNVRTYAIIDNKNTIVQQNKYVEGVITTTIPDNGTILCLSIYNTLIETAQVNKGDTLLPYDTFAVVPSVGEHALLENLDAYISDEEYIRAYVDAEGKLLWGIKKDGSIEFAKGVPTPIKKYLLETIPNGLDFVAKTFSEYEDEEERLELILDAEGRVVKERKSSGELVEHAGIETSRLRLPKSGFLQFVKDMKDVGVNVTSVNDLSEETHIVIPIPTSIAKVNIIADTFPSSKESNLSGIIEFADKNGNYFSKPIEGFALQGSTSLAAPKKNLKFDFSDCDMKIGNWVVQDGFHLKSNYYDVFRGKSNLAYDFWRTIIEYNRPPSFRTPFVKKDSYSYYNGVNCVEKDFSEARLTPAGFPVEVYFNGEFIGVYTWNIKKDRANYAMKKNNADHIHIDPAGISSILKGEGLDWTTFEIRNPKGLVTMNGSSYNGDAPLELIDTSSAYYNSANTDHVKSAKVKQKILAFKDACAEVISKKDRETFEKYFDPSWFVDLLIWGNVILDGDSLYRNTQYLCWGDKWYGAPYDCDQIYGNTWRGNYIYRKTWNRNVNSSIIGKSMGIYELFLELYSEEIAARYKELRDNDVISVESVCSKLEEYRNIIGLSAYEKEFEKWAETPCYREPNDSKQWEFQGDYYEGTSAEWDSNKAYNVGDYAYIIIEGEKIYWKCKEANTGVRPYVDKFTNAPIVGGFFDSLIRVEQWLKERLIFLDSQFNS